MQSPSRSLNIPAALDSPLVSTDTLRSRLIRLAKNRVYMSIVFALCGLFFVVTGINFWATSYLNNVYSMGSLQVQHSNGVNSYPWITGHYKRKTFARFNRASVFVKETGTELLFYDGKSWNIASVDGASSAMLPLSEHSHGHRVLGPGSWVSPDTARWPPEYSVQAVANRELIYGCFAAVAATGPTLGVIFGGRVIDRLGGYHGHTHLVRSLKVCSIFAALATLVGLAVSLLDVFWLIVPGLWLVLFFGGSILPPATGMLLAVVDPGVRPLASAASMFFYNVFGYALGSILPGMVMEWIPARLPPGPYADPRYAELWGMRLILWSSVIGLGGILTAWGSASREPSAGAPTAADIRDAPRF